MTSTGTVSSVLIILCAEELLAVTKRICCRHGSHRTVGPLDWLTTKVVALNRSVVGAASLLQRNVQL